MLNRNFVIRLAVDAFNHQFGYNFNHGAFDLISIDTESQTHCAFEVYTTRFDDQLRLRCYANLGSKNHVGQYVLKENDDPTIGNPGDQVPTVFVANMELDQEFLHLNNNFIRKSGCQFDVDLMRLMILLKESQEAFTMEDGSYVLLEEGR